jgi:autotransporter-like protein
MLAGICFVSPAQAQKALCPANVPAGAPGQPGIFFDGGECTNGTTGAYSNAALASQSLGELSQSSTQDATRATMASISQRRTTEQQDCPAGSTRVNGACVPTAVSRFAAEPSDATVPDELLAFAPRVTKALPYRPAPEAPHMAVWAQAYGNYERLSGRGTGLGEFSILALNVESTTRSGGVLGGADYTFRNLGFAGDGLIVGVLAGYEASHLSLTSSSTSSVPTDKPNGFSTMKAQLSGPAAGVYASYFNGRFSTDLAFKAEFYDLNLAFTDLLGFHAVPAAGFPPTTALFSGSGTTQLNNYTTAGNVNYRIPTSAITWIEPTGGFQYVMSRYASGADQFGLADGELLRLQGGARFGFESIWNGVRVTTVATGLLYDDVVVTGGQLATAPNPLILSEQGKLRAEGILTLNVYHGNGLNSFVQADLRGGEGLFGATGKVGARFTW